MHGHSKNNIIWDILCETDACLIETRDAWKGGKTAIEVSRQSNRVGSSQGIVDLQGKEDFSSIINTQECPKSFQVGY